MDDILKYSAIELARLIREGKVTSKQVVETFINQAKRVNSSINAIVEDRYEQALKEAEKADAMIASGAKNLPPLLGVPCSIKEAIALKDMRLTQGVVEWKENVSDEDATVVKRLREAGAIPVGKTNLCTLMLYWESDNKIYGVSRNPHNLKHTPGGSSGGEGAIISCSGTPFGIGSDIGGSIRMPAAFCGIFGHKPSPYLVPLTGHGEPNQILNESGLAVMGPLARHAEDLMPILKVISGPDSYDKYTREIKLRDPNDVKIRDLTYIYFEPEGLHPDVLSAYLKTVDTIKKSGAKTKSMELGLFRKSAAIASALIGDVSQRANLLGILTDKSILKTYKEIFLELFGLSDYPIYVSSFALMQKKNKPPRKLIEKGLQFRKDIQKLLGEDKVILYPTHPYPPVKLGGALKVVERFGFTGIFNALHCPATSIPMGLSQDGLPMGIQAVAKAGNDHLTIATAMYLEGQGYKWIVPNMAE